MSVEKSLDPFRLDGQVALVTGGGTGLGLAIARCLLAAGARPVLVGRRLKVLEQAAAALSAPDGAPVVTIACDLERLKNLPELVAQIEAEYGELSILVNNAGIHRKGPAVDTSNAEFAAVVRIHLEATFALAREAARVMLPRRRGSIVFISSMAGLFGVPQIPAYSAAKTAVIGLTRALATEWSPYEVRVNALAPGWIDEGMARQTLESNPERKRRVLDRTPMGRLGSPEDVGWAAVYLCSPAARFITGQVLAVDGGASIGF